MRITSLEIRSHPLKKGLRGYDVREVEELRELAADALEEAMREISALQDRLKDASGRISEHMANEAMLKDTITTAQKMVGDLKNNAMKEAELLVTEARLQAEDIVRQAQTRSTKLQEEIFRLKKQRNELEVSIKAILDYHSSTLLMEEDESRKADEESDKLKFLPKP